MSRYARKTDRTHQAVVEAFKASGWRVLQTFRLGDDVPDLMVSKAGRVVAVEVKTLKGKLKPGQQQWLDAWQAETAVVRSVDDVLQLSRGG